MEFPCQRDRGGSLPRSPGSLPRSPKRPRSWTFTLEHLQGDLYALTQGGETSLGSKDEIKARLDELVGGFL